MFGSLHDPTDSEVMDYKVPYIELQINGNTYQAIHNTSYDNSLVSMEQLLQMGDITNLKSRKQVFKFINNTKLHVIGSIDIKVNWKSQKFELLFFLKRTDLPHVIIGKFYKFYFRNGNLKEQKVQYHHKLIR